MKTSKILLPLAALFVSALAFGQNGNSGNRVKVTTTTTTHTKANNSRVNGSSNANARANENAQRNANENSVLNGTPGVKTKYGTKRKGTYYSKRRNDRKTIS